MGAAPHHRAPRSSSSCSCTSSTPRSSGSTPRRTTRSSAPTRRRSWASASSRWSPRSACTRSTACASSLIDFCQLGHQVPAGAVLDRHRRSGSLLDARLRAAPPDARVRRRVTMTDRSTPPAAVPSRPHAAGSNWEKWGWLYMRVSGVLLVVLIFGHLFVNLFLGEGVQRDRLRVRRRQARQPVLDRLGHAAALARPHPRRQRHAHPHQRLRPRQAARRPPRRARPARRSSSSSWEPSCSPPSTRASADPTTDALIEVCSSVRPGPTPWNSTDGDVIDGVHYHQFDVVIVGAGGAGMRAAIEAGPEGQDRGHHEALPDPLAHRRGAGRHGRRARQRRRGLAGSGTPSTPSRAATTWSTRMRRRSSRKRRSTRSSTSRTWACRSTARPTARSTSAASAGTPATTARRPCAAPATPPTAPAT